HNQDFAVHYGVTVIPARVRKPQDKAKAEKGVQTVENWILGPLRHRTFFSLTELNQAIREGLRDLNERPFQKLNGCRRSLFESLDQPVMRPLPVEAYDYAEWKKVRVHIDYHVEVERHYYSVPFKFIHRQVEVRITAKTVEVFCKGLRIASHPRSFRQGGHTTLVDHMPKSHREYLDWPPERLQRQAEQIGFFTGQAIARLLERRPHPAQGRRSCLGVLRLAKDYGEDRLERACQRALLIQAISYQSIRSILKSGLDRLPPPEPPPPAPPLEHDNLRGPTYFH
ncbi:MAG: Mu transposase domain-containing protein, partial [Candidatus Hinthialibacter sp.]